MNVIYLSIDRTRILHFFFNFGGGWNMMKGNEKKGGKGEKKVKKEKKAKK